ncbi:hypothetical protein D3C81_2165320 [compost metagenome]
MSQEIKMIFLLCLSIKVPAKGDITILGTTEIAINNPIMAVEPVLLRIQTLRAMS